MRIEDLVNLLNNRLREFKLSGDYARMNGDLERMNTADKEVIALEDTLFKLNLLVDTSKSAAVKEKVLAEVITDGSVSVLGEYDITRYATDPLHEEKIMNILSKMAVMDTVEKIDDYINGKYLSSPVTGEMIMSASLAYEVDARLMMAMMEQDSGFGIAGKAVRTLNPGNVGNDDSGNLRTYESWQEGVTAVAEWLSRHRGSTIISEIPEEIVVEPIAPATASSSEETIPVITSTTTTTTASSSFSPTPTPITTPIVTVSPSPTSSPSFSPTPTPEVVTSTTTTTTASSSFSPTPEPTPTPTPVTTTTTTTTASSSFSPTPTPSPEASDSAEATTDTSAGEAEPTPEPTPEATPTPEPEPESEPTPAPLASPEPEAGEPTPN